MHSELFLYTLRTFYILYVYYIFYVLRYLSNYARETAYYRTAKWFPIQITKAKLEQMPPTRSDPIRIAFLPFSFTNVKPLLSCKHKWTRGWK